MGNYFAFFEIPDFFFLNNPNDIVVEEKFGQSKKIKKSVRKSRVPVEKKKSFVN